MILSLLNSLFYNLFSSKLFKEYANHLKLAVVILSVLAILYRIIFGDFSFQILKLQHINLFAALLLLAILNLIVESRAWKIILKGYNNIGFKECFRLICECYPTMSFSTSFLGSVLGKQSFFGAKKIGTNIYKNISFGLYQSFASISLAFIIIIFSQSQAKLSYFEQMDISLNSYLISVISVSFGILVFLLARKWIKVNNISVLLFTYARSSIYYLQYICVILFFYAPADVFLAVALIAVYFLLKTLIPFMNIFGGIGTRELTLSVLFSYADLNTSYIVLGALLIWVANFIFPNILGLLSILKRRNCLVPSSS